MNIDRDIEVDAFTGARVTLRNTIEVDRFLGDEGRRRTLFRRQSAYREFANRITKQDRYTDSSHYHVTHHNLEGLNVSVLLVDSSWLCEGGENDSHSILVGERQLLDLSDAVPSRSFTVAIMHHPLDWLAPFEHTTIKNLLADSCHLLFRGHVHEDSIDSISSSQNKLKVFTAGAAYESRLSANCYGYGSIDLHTGDGVCIVHKYKNDSKTWEPQEPVSWTLTDREYYSIELTDVADLIGPLAPPFPNYLICLIAQNVTEIPVLYAGQVVFLSVTTTTASTSSLTKSILRLRFLMHWRDCWESSPLARSHPTCGDFLLPSDFSMFRRSRDTSDSDRERRTMQKDRLGDPR